MGVYMEGLNEMTEAMQEEVVHLEEVLVENKRIFNEQYRKDWDVEEARVKGLQRIEEIRLEKNGNK